MIAVTFALPAESSAFLRKLEEISDEGEILRGSLRSTGKDRTIPVAVIHTGVGRGECDKRLQAFLHRNKPELIVSSGFCGGATNDLKPGDLVLAQNYSAENLLSHAREVIPNARLGPIYSADEIVHTESDRYAIGRQYGAIAIDMETEAIAQLASENKIAMISLRVVSDSPAAPFPAPPHVLFDVEAQRTRFSRFLKYLARDPAAIGRLVQFSKHMASARTTLADALVQLLAGLQRRTEL